MQCRIFNLVIIIILFAVVGSTELYSSENKVISPEKFQWMTETSADLLGRIKTYNSEIDLYKPYVYLDYDNVLTPGYEYTAPTPIGPWNVGPVEGNLGLYIGVEHFGFIAVVNGINLLIDDKHKTGIYSNLDGWASYNYLGGVRFALDSDFQLIGGAVMKQTPYFVKIDDDLKFSAYTDKNGAIQTNENRVEAFALLKLFGYDIVTFYNSDKKRASSLDLSGNVFDKGDSGRFDFQLSYYDLSTTVQGGFKYDDFFILSFLSLGTSATFNIYSEDKNRSVIADALIYDRIFIFRDSPLRSKESTDDFYIVIRTGLSVSRDLFDEYLYGYMAEVSGVNIKVLGSRTQFLAGGSYNYDETLNRMPVKDQFLVSFKVKFMF